MENKLCEWHSTLIVSSPTSSSPYSHTPLPSTFTSHSWQILSYYLQVAVALEKVALSDEYFVERKLYPNVDFYSGLIYRAIGFPTEFFPVLFAIPRMAGYLAHWRESLDDPDTKIMRPAQVYTGVWLRHYTSLKDRVPSTEADKFGQVSVSNATRRRLAGSGD